MPTTVFTSTTAPVIQHYRIQSGYIALYVFIVLVAIMCTVLAMLRLNQTQSRQCINACIPSTFRYAKLFNKSGLQQTLRDNDEDIHE